MRPGPNGLTPSTRRFVGGLKCWVGDRQIFFEDLLSPSHPPYTKFDRLGFCAACSSVDRDEDPCGVSRA